MSLNIDFYYSNSCSSCRRFASIVGQIEKERTHAEVSSIEYKREDHPDIKYVPTIVVSYAGKELGRFSSALAKKDIDGWLDQLDEYIKEYLEVSPDGDDH